VSLPRRSLSVTCVRDGLIALGNRLLSRDREALLRAPVSALLLEAAMPATEDSIEVLAPKEGELCSGSLELDVRNWTTLLVEADATPLSSTRGSGTKGVENLELVVTGLASEANIGPVSDELLDNGLLSNKLVGICVSTPEEYVDGWV